MTMFTLVACGIGEYGEEKLVDLLSNKTTIRSLSFTGLFSFFHSYHFILSVHSSDLHPTSAFPSRLFSSLRNNESVTSLYLQGL